MKFIGMMGSGGRLYKATHRFGQQALFDAMDFARLHKGQVFPGSHLSLYPGRWYVIL